MTPLRQNREKLFQGNVLQYHSFFVGVQAFAFTLTSTANVLSAIISFYLAITWTGIMMIAVVAVNTCVCRDPRFFASPDFSEASGWIDRVHPHVEEDTIEVIQ